MNIGVFCSRTVLALTLTVFAVTVQQAFAVEKDVRKESGKLIVEVLIFSGRPNPKWDLTDVDNFKELRNQIKALPKAKAIEWTGIGLGFRGIRLINKGLSNFPDEVCVFQGVVRVKTEKKILYFKDAKNLEGMLISASMGKKLDAGVVNVLKRYKNARK